MICCKDCAHCATMLHYENAYICTMGGECIMMDGLTASTPLNPGECDFFVTVDDYFTEILSN